MKFAVNKKGISTRISIIFDSEICGFFSENKVKVWECCCNISFIEKLVITLKRMKFNVSRSPILKFY